LADELVRENLVRLTALSNEASTALFNCGIADYERGAFENASENLLRAWKMRGDNDPVKASYWSFLTDCELRGGRKRISIQIDGPINCFAIDPSNSGIAVTSSEKTAWLIDTRSGAMIGKPICHQDTISSLSFSPKGSCVATASHDNTSRLWCARTGEPLGPPMRHEGKINFVAFNPDGNLVATGSSDKTARLWDVHSGMQFGAPMAHDGEVTYLAFHANGKLLATISADGQIWNVLTQKSIFFVPCPCTSIAFSPDGNSFATTSFEIATLRRTLSGEVLGESMVHPFIQKIGFSPDGCQFATMNSSMIRSQSGSLRFWDTKTGAPLGQVVLDDLHSFTFSPDGNLLVTCSGNTARFWDARTYRSLGAPIVHENSLALLALFSPDSSELAIQSTDSKIQLWNLVFPEIIDLDEHADSLLFSPDNHRIATKNFNSVQLWDPWSGSNVGEPIRHLVAGTSEHVKSSLAFSIDGNLIVVAKGNDLRILSVATGEVVDKRTTNGVNANVAFSPNGRLIVTAESFSLHIWDVSTGSSIRIDEAHELWVSHIDVRADSQIIVSCSSDRTARLWDATTGESIGRPMIHSHEVNYVSFSPDGNRIVTACRDGSASLWDALSGKPIAERLVHDAEVCFAAFTSDGTEVITKTIRESTYVWNAISGELARPIEYGNSPCKTLLSPNANRVATIVGEEVQFWDAISCASLGIIKLTAVGSDKIDPDHCKYFFSPDGNRFCLETTDKIKVWETQGLKVISEIPMEALLGNQKSAWIRAFAFSDRGLMATASDDKTARLWDTQTGLQFQQPLQHDSDVVHVTFSPDGSLVATATKENYLIFWSVKTATRHGIAMRHESDINAICFSPDGCLFATASNDCTARIWDALTGTAIGLPMQHESGVNSIAFSPNSMQLVTCSGNQIRLWDVRTGSPSSEITCGDQWIHSVVFDSEICELIAAEISKHIVLWDAKTGKPICAPIRPDHIQSVAFHWGQNIVATASGNTVRIWNAKTGVPIAAPFEHQARVQANVFSSDGRQIATTDSNKRLLIWELDRAVPNVPTGFQQKLEGSIAPVTLSDEPSFQNEINASFAKKRLDWQKQIARTALDEKHFFSAVFHLRWLSKQDPDNLECRSQLELASALLSAENTNQTEAFKANLIKARSYVGRRILESGVFPLLPFEMEIGQSGFEISEESEVVNPCACIANWIDFVESNLLDDMQIDFQIKHGDPTDANFILERAHAVVLKCNEPENCTIEWRIILGAILLRQLQFDEAKAVLSNTIEHIDRQDEFNFDKESLYLCKIMSHAILAIVHRESHDLESYNMQCNMVRRYVEDRPIALPFWLGSILLAGTHSSRASAFRRYAISVAVGALVCILLVVVGYLLIAICLYLGVNPRFLIALVVILPILSRSVRARFRK